MEQFDDEVGMNYQDRLAEGRLKIEKMEAALKSEPCDHWKIAAVLGVTKPWAHKLLWKHYRAGKIYITRWDRYTFSGPLTPTFAWGSKKDAPKPPNLDPKERQRRWRENNQDKVDSLNALKRARRSQCLTVAQIDPLLALLTRCHKNADQNTTTQS